MKIFFTASVSAGREYIANHQKIVECLINLGHQVLSKHVASQNLTQKGKDSPPKFIFEREKERILKADVVMAEVTQPSTGVGFLVSFALRCGKPVLVLFYKEADDLLSPMIVGNPSANLYLEHYSFDDIKLVLKNFLKHIEKNHTRKGKLIIIEGGDGSGKKTQLDLLVQYLENHSTKKIHALDFPQYYSSFHGRTVGRFLSGEFGTLQEVNPYLASLAYVLDRLSVKEQMDEWLEAGDYVLCNRYVTSSMAHQTAKLSGIEREKFLDWIYELEYKKHKLPLEDTVIYLHVPFKVAQKLIAKKDKRKYLKDGKKDIAEEDTRHQLEAEKVYLKLTSRYKQWVKVDCVGANGRLRSKKSIGREIIRKLTGRKIIE